MKRTTTVLTLVALLVFSLSAFAGEGSDTVGKGNLMPQLRYTYSENRYMSGYDKDTNFLATSNIGDLRVDYGLTDNVDLYGILGYQNMLLLVDNDGSRHSSHINAMLWGIGAKATLLRADNGLYFGGNLSFTHTFTPDSSRFTFYSSDEDMDRDEAFFTELAVRADLHAGWNIEKLGLTPYLGVEYLWSMAYITHRSEWESGHYDDCGETDLSRKHLVGMFVGVDYAVNDKLFVNLEGNMFNRWGGSASVGYKFDISDINFAGSGSDTVGACKLLPQVRYSFIQNRYDTRNDDYYRGDWNVESSSVYLQLDYGVTDNVDVYGLVGYKHIHVGKESDNYDVDFDAFLWGAGVKATFYRADNGFYVGGNFLFTQSITPNKRNDTWNYHTYWNELNAKGDIFAGWRFEKIGLTPYVGVEYLWAMAHIEQRSNGDDINCASFYLNQPHPVGVYVGVDYLLNDRLFINLEGNMINRWGGSVGIGYMFDICGKPAPAPEPAPAPVIEPKLEPMSKN